MATPKLQEPQADANQGPEEHALIAAPEGTLQLYGHVMLDSGYNFGQIDPNWFDVMRPSKLPAFKDDVSRLPAEVARRYAYLKLGSDNIKWKQIPWVLDLSGAIRVAKEEKRPLLLWVSGDDPLERC